jgi:hypothetical protein
VIGRELGVIPLPGAVKQGDQAMVKHIEKGGERPLIAIGPGLLNYELAVIGR